MKIYIAFLSLVCCLAMTRCAKDQGNYDYTQVNKLTVVDEDGTAITNKTYRITYGDNLTIKPKVTNSTVAGVDNFKFFWILGQDTLGSEPVFNLTSEELGTGTKYGKLIVMDVTTQASYSYNFTVIVSASISKGSFILTEDPDHFASISMRAEGDGMSYLHFYEFAGHKLGKYPLSFELGYRIPNLQTRNYVSLMTLVKESDKPIAVIDLGTLTPTMFYTKEAAMISGQTFEPSRLLIPANNLSTNNLSGYVVVNGKAHVIAKGVVGENMYLTDPKNYHVGEQGITPSIRNGVGNFMAVYDQKNSSLRVFNNNSISTRYNIFDRDFDDITANTLLTNQEYINSTDIVVSSPVDWRYQFLTRKENELYVHNIHMKTTSPISPERVSSYVPKTIANLDKAVNFRYDMNLNFWYFALGRTIYRFSYLGLDIQPYLTLPADDTGDIVSWNFDVPNIMTGVARIGIATYNPTATTNYKGSYYLYDIVNSNYIVKDKYVTHKAIDLKVGY